MERAMWEAQWMPAVVVALAMAAALAACGGGGTATSDSTPEVAPLSAQAALGEKIFADASLSASGRQSCASCHDPAHGHSPANALAAQPGGPNGDLQGTRKTPGIRYLAANTPFFFAADGMPTGGFFWDGRGRNFAEQATEPFINPFEMANVDKAAVIAKVAAAPYAGEFKRLFGADIFTDVEGAYLRLSLAVQQYERDGTPPLFTDFTYDNLGVPRNPDLQRNADPAYFDLGLCQRADLVGRTDLCGAFKVPSLRNVALREAYFHNGRFKTLKDALTFYVQRDTDPGKFYPTDASGAVMKFDDLPLRYRGNVNTEEVPYNRRLGDTPALSDVEIDDVITFLRTLSDGYTP